MSAQASGQKPADVRRVFEKAVAKSGSGRAEYLAGLREMAPALADEVAELLGYATIDSAPEQVPASFQVSLSSPAPQRYGNYQTVRELGTGGQARVYLADDLQLHRPVALKVLTRKTLSSRSAAERFRREAEITARLDHPSICPVYDFGVEDGVPWIAMKFIPGEPLTRLLAAERGEAAGAAELLPTLPAVPADATPTPTPKGDAGARSSTASNLSAAWVARMIRLVEASARGVHAAHEKGIIHRDLKPANIMVATDGTPVILDFGLAHETEGEHPTLTASGDVLGTPAYMSPEQIAAQRIDVDRRTDVYSLGVTLYECLTLKRPFDAPTRQALFHAILTKEAADPRPANRAISSDLVIVLRTAMEKDRDRRYKTALDFAEDLRRIRVHEPIVARRPNAVVRFFRWAQRNPAPAISLAVVIVTLMAAAAAMGWAWVMQTRAVEEKDAALAANRRLLDQRNVSRALQVTEALLGNQLYGQDWSRLRKPVRDWWNYWETKRGDLQLQAGQPAPESLDKQEQLLSAVLLDLLQAGPRSEDRAPAQAARVVLQGHQAIGDTLKLLEDGDRAWASHLNDWKNVNDRLRTTGELPGGRALSPIWGLVPLGPNPTTGREEFWDARTGKLPEEPDDGSTGIGGDDGLVLVLIPAKRILNESRPSVMIDVPSFLISKYEVTRGQWYRMSRERPSFYAQSLTALVVPSELSEPGLSDAFPVENVSWTRSRQILLAYGMDHPTDAQFRIASQTRYGGQWWELAEAERNAARWNTKGFIGLRFGPSFNKWSIPIPVGRYTDSNPFGLYDIIGNVGEFVRSDNLIFRHPVPPADEAALRHYRGVPLDRELIGRMPPGGQDIGELTSDQVANTIGFRPVIEPEWGP